MYSILIYIIIAFLFYLFGEDIRKKYVEGNTLESYDYQEFQSIINDDIIDEQLKQHINKHSKDIDSILKNTIKDKNIDSDFIDEEKKKGLDSSNILYDINVRDVLGELDDRDYDETSYEKYLNNYSGFNKTDDILNKTAYSNAQLDLFKKKYIKKVLYSNEDDYMDINDVNERIKKVNEEINSGKYVKEGVNFPGFISKSRGEVINNIVEKNDKDDKGIFIKDMKFCCDYSTLNLQNVPILSESESAKVNKRMRHTEFDDDEEPVEMHFEYNYPYYKYMGEGDRIYDSLYLNYNKTRNIGDLNL